ncbi:30S ribosomal protein S15 [Candidatus Dependentiae bacterium]|nr:30S ribosomal protein S15 [Candidatus Dependentiae bacterium]
MLSKEAKKELVNKFAKSNNDTGSCEVQIAILSERIQQISDHLRTFPKDKQSRLGLIKLVGKRKTLSRYLKKHDKESYDKLSKELKVKG